ncbi:MAG TPA: substrate-binding domain-containing protein [Dongiaceae bacterium]|nr:substrate-binding domain-containing protein [Dongiaceae bacterium]
MQPERSWRAKMQPWGKAVSMAAFCVFVFGGRAKAADTVEAVDHSALRVCADPHNLPFSDQQGEGFENKIAELFAQNLQVPLRYVWYPNTVGFLRNTLRARQCDLVMGIVSGAELVQSTNPYYRSSYVIVTRKADDLAVAGIDDPKLRDLKIGLTAGTPPSDLAVRSGLIGNVQPYPLFVDTRYDAPGKQMIDDLLQKKIDVALLWGPIAGYFARDHAADLMIAPLKTSESNLRLDFYIAMGVRPGENKWKNQVNDLIRQNQTKIAGILHDYGIPTLDGQGNPVP